MNPCEYQEECPGHDPFIKGEPEFDTKNPDICRFIYRLNKWDCFNDATTKQALNDAIDKDD